MGSIVSVGKRVAARACRGRVYYALFEATYDPDSRPHTAYESCIAFGTLSQVLPAIINRPAKAPGGRLKGKSGRITPAGYLRGWLKAFDQPATLLVRPVVATAKRGLEVSATECLDGLVARLRHEGYTAESGELAADGTVTCDLGTQAGVIACLCEEGERCRIQPWRLLTPSDVDSYQPSCLAPARLRMPAPAISAQVYDTGVIRFGHEPVLAMHVAGAPAGRWRRPPFWGIGVGYSLHERYLGYLAKYADRATEGWDPVRAAMAAGPMFAPQQRESLDESSIIDIDIAGADPGRTAYMRQSELCAFTDEEHTAPDVVRTTWARIKELEMAGCMAVERHARFGPAPACQELATLESNDGEVNARLYRAAPARFMVSVQGRTSGQCDRFPTMEAALTYADGAVSA